MEKINQLIINRAKSYIGQKEKPGNIGFMDHDFEESMKDNGFLFGYAWCAIFAKLVWREAYRDYNRNILIALDAIFSVGALDTLSRFKKSNLFEFTKTPKPGALIFWQRITNGKPDWRGHVGIFLQMDGGKMLTIEGNTNGLGSREGDGVHTQAREINYFANNGLRLLGFINPKP